jgi:cysteinyl-tRNA synthetase
LKDGLIPTGALAASTIKLMQEKFHTFLEVIFGLRSENTANNDMLKGVMQLLIDIRKEAKGKKDFATSDKIRNQLTEIGILLKDEKDGGMSWNVN